MVRRRALTSGNYLLRVAPLWLGLTFAAPPEAAVGQNRADTAAVLRQIGRHFSAAGPSPAAVLTAAPDSGPAGPGTVSLAMARVVAEGAGLPLLAQQPEVPCDTGERPIRITGRPWLRRSIQPLRVTFGGDTAVVRALLDLGEAACPKYRDRSEWAYHLHRTGSVWQVTLAYRSTMW